jgi:hypothetical protein
MKLILLVTSILFLGAGLAMGRLSARLPGALHAHGMPSSWFYDQLKLSDDQRTQIDAIWADMRAQMSKESEKRHDLDHQRDDAVRNLLTDSQKAAYDKIYADYHAQRQAIEQQRQQILSDADQRSRALLDDTQKAKWDELTKEIHDRRAFKSMTTQQSGNSEQTTGGQQSTTTRPVDPAGIGG